MAAAASIEQSRMMQIVEVLAWGVGAVALAALLSAVAPSLSIASGVVLIVGLVVAKLARAPLLRRVGTRALGALWLSLCLIGIGGNRIDEQAAKAELLEAQRVQELVDREQPELEALRASDPVAYLDRIKDAGRDDEWIAELAALDPAAHAEEVDRRKVAAAEQAELAQAQAGAALRASLNAAADEIEGHEGFTYSSLSDVFAALEFFDAHARKLADTEGALLDKQAAASRDRLIRVLSDTQVREFPRMRDAYGPIQRRNNMDRLYDRDIDVRTTGPRYDRFVMTGTWFVSRQNRRLEFENASADLLRLRFRDASFSPRSGAGTTWTVLAPEDDEIAQWKSYLNIDGGFYNLIE